MIILQKILLAIDGSDSCNMAIPKVAELAKKLEAEVTILTVIEKNISLEVHSKSEFEEVVSKKGEYGKEADEIISECLDVFDEGLKLNKIIKAGNPADVICDLAKEENCDLIALSDMGRSAAKRFLLGSTTEKVVRHAKTSVLVIK